MHGWVPLPLQYSTCLSSFSRVGTSRGKPVISRRALNFGCARTDWSRRHAISARRMQSSTTWSAKSGASCSACSSWAAYSPAFAKQASAVSSSPSSAYACPVCRHITRSSFSQAVDLALGYPGNHILSRAQVPLAHQDVIVRATSTSQAKAQDMPLINAMRTVTRLAEGLGKRASKPTAQKKRSLLEISSLPSCSSCTKLARSLQQIQLSSTTERLGRLVTCRGIGGAVALACRLKHAFWTQHPKIAAEWQRHSFRPRSMPELSLPSLRTRAVIAGVHTKVLHLCFCSHCN